MYFNFWLFRFQKQQLAKHYSSDRVRLFQATVLSNIFLGCAAIVLVFSAGVKIVFPELMDPLSKKVFLVLDFSLSGMCLMAYGFLQLGYFKTGREIFTIAAVVATLSGVMLTGGFPNSIVIPCLVILPVAANLFYGGKTGFWLTTAILGIVLIQWFAVLYMGLVLPDFTSKASTSVNAMIVFSMTFGGIVAMVSIYQNWNQRLQLKLTEERQNLARLANQDALTGLANSRKFHDELEKFSQQANADCSSFTVLFIDLDDFKIINDSFGHLAGDKVLKAVANRIEDSVGSGDIVARIGGDEFAILLQPGTDELSVDKIKIRLRKSALRPIHVDGKEYLIGMSIGQSVFLGNCDDVTGLLKQADQSMYRDKSRKNNRKPKKAGAMQNAKGECKEAAA